MKKRMVNVLLSAAVVATMMCGVTACGSKDKDSASSGADSTTVESSVADAADEADGMTAADWVKSEEAATYTQLFNTMFDGAMTAKFEADGNTLSMVFTLSEETLGTDGADLTDEQKEAAQALMQQQYDGVKDQFIPMRDELKESIGASDLVVRIVYETSNGTELFSQDL